MAQEIGGPLSVTLEARQIVYVNSARRQVTLLEPAFEPSAMSASGILLPYPKSTVNLSKRIWEKLIQLGETSCAESDANDLHSRRSCRRP